MSSETVRCEVIDGGVAIVELNRPASLNAMNARLREEFSAAVFAFDERSDIGAIIITGAGQKAFSAGGDIRELVTLSPDEVAAVEATWADTAWRLANTRIPTIGAINGLCFGGAAALATSLDIRFGCDRTSFRFLAAQYGRVNSSWTLPNLVGLGLAKELLFSGRLVEHEEAVRIGLLNRSVPSDRLMDVSIELARLIASNVPSAVQGIKRILNESIGRPLSERFAMEHRLIETELATLPVSDKFRAFAQRPSSETLKV